MAAVQITTPCTVAKSRLNTASTISLPKPGTEKTCSVSTAPDRSCPNSSAPEGDDRDRGIGQRVAQDQPQGRDALGPGRADVVGAEHAQHRRAGVAHHHRRDGVAEHEGRHHHGARGSPTGSRRARRSRRPAASRAAPRTAGSSGCRARSSAPTGPRGRSRWRSCRRPARASPPRGCPWARRWRAPPAWRGRRVRASPAASRRSSSMTGFCSRIDSPRSPRSTPPAQ